MSAIRIIMSGIKGTRVVMQGEKIIATLSNERPTKANERKDTYAVCWVSGRVDWHGTYSEARDNVLKGSA